MPGLPARRADAFEAVALVQADGIVHAAERFQVAVAEAERTGRIEATPQHLAADALATDLLEEVHLAQLTGIRVATLQWRHAATADDLVLKLDHEIGAARPGVGALHPVDLGIVDRETLAGSAELRHHRADDRGDIGVVARLDRTDPPRQGHQVPSLLGG